MHQLPATASLPFTFFRTGHCVLLLMFGLGLGEGFFVPSADFSNLHLMVGLLINYLCLLWYRSDRDARGFRHSGPLSAAMFLVPLAAIPYYVLRRWPVQERGNAIGAFVGMLMLVPLARWAGVLAHQAVRQIGA
jgi:hypothetical protein